MEVTSHKLMDLVFALCMQILELVQISLDIEPVRSENVWLPLDQVLTLHPRDLTRHRQLQPHSTPASSHLTVVNTWARWALALSMQYLW